MSRAALEFQVQDAVEDLTGGEYVTAYRAMRPEDDSGAMGGASLSLDPIERKGRQTKEFKVHHSDILVFSELNPHSFLGNPNMFGHEREVILKPEASPRLKVKAHADHDQKSHGRRGPGKGEDETAASLPTDEEYFEALEAYRKTGEGREKLRAMVNAWAKAAGYGARGKHGLAEGELEGNSFMREKLGSNTGAASAGLGFFFSRGDTAIEYGRAELDYEKATELDYEALQEMQRVDEALREITGRSLEDVLDAPVYSSYSEGILDPSSYFEAANAKEYVGDLQSRVDGIQKDLDWSSTDFEGEQADQIEKLAESMRPFQARLDEVEDYAAADIATVDAYLKMENPSVHDQQGSRYREESYFAIIQTAWADGHDSVEILNTYDGGALDDILIVKNPNQIKSAALATYDDDGKLIPLSKRFNSESDDVRSKRVKVHAHASHDQKSHGRRGPGSDSSSDEEYFQALEAGDMEAAQRMVDEAAKRAEMIKVWHVSENHPEDIFRTKRKYGEIGAYFSPEEQDQYPGEGKQYFIRLGNNRELDLIETIQVDESFDKIRGDIESLTGIDENGEIYEYVVFDPSQIKSADPITYDDEGKIIPLSKRFNLESSDIRSKHVKAHADHNQKDHGRRGVSPEEYRINHQPGEDDIPLFDLESGVPEDIYSSRAKQFYGHGSPGEDETLAIMRRVRGNPKAPVKIYRVVPDYAEKINSGDWITLSKADADMMNHGEFLGRDKAGKPIPGKILEMEVHAEDIVWPGDSLAEFGYFPKKKGGKTSDVRSKHVKVHAHASHDQKSHGRRGPTSSTSSSNEFRAKLYLDPEQAGDAIADHWIRFGNRKGSTAREDERGEMSEGWARTLKEEGIAADSIATKRLEDAITEAEQSPLYMEAQEKMGGDIIVLVDQGKNGPVASRGGVLTRINSDAIKEMPISPQQITPPHERIPGELEGIAERQSLASVVHHEYGHRIDDYIRGTEGHKKIMSNYRDNDPHAVSWYAGAYPDGREWIPELFSLANHPQYKPGDYPGYVNDSIAIIKDEIKRL